MYMAKCPTPRVKKLANDATLSREGGAGHFINKYYDVTEEYIIHNLY